MKKYSVIILVVIAIIAIALIANSNGSKQVSGETIKIGAMIPVTGDAAVYGQPALNLYQMAAEEINSKGGIDGKRVEIITEDSKCNGKDGSTAAQKLMGVDKVKAIIGGFCSSESLAAVPLAEQYKVVLLSPGSSSPDLTGKSKYFFRNYPSDATQGAVLAEVAYTKLGLRKAGFIQEQLDYPLGIFKAFSAQFEKLGGTVVKEEFASDVTDFRSSLTKLQAQNPDLLFVDTQAPASAERILQQLANTNWRPKIFIADSISGDPKTVERNKEILEGAFAAEFGIDSTNEQFKSMIAAYKSKYGEEPPYQSYAQTEFDALFLLKDGIEKVGYDGTKLAEWSRTIKDWKGASGKTTIGTDGDRVGGHQPKIIRNGKVELYKE